MNNALYLEADEEITSAIDRMLKLPGRQVSIVVPKRSTLLQSIVNLKLLKRAADTGGKELVLVTTDRTSTHLAARVGLAVAPNLKAAPVKAELPQAEPETPAEIEESDEPEEGPEEGPEDDEGAPGGPDDQAAADVPAKPTSPKPSFAKGVMVRKPISSDDAAAGGTAKPGKGPKIPDFNRMQRMILWGGLGLLVIIVLLVINYFVSSAKVTLFAKADKVTTNFNLSVDPSAKTPDTAKVVLPGQQLQSSKDLSAGFTPTGSRDVGTKASGSMTLYNGTGVDQPIAAGTKLVAPDSKVFHANGDVTIPHGGLDAQGNVVNGQASVGVTADQNGDSYNEGPAHYTIPSISSDVQAKVYGQGGQMSGGTSKKVTIVTQADVDKAKSDLLSQNQAGAQKDLESKAPSGWQPLSDSFSQTVNNADSNPDVDQEATKATLSLKVSYTELAINQNDYHNLIRAQEQKQVGAANQIYDDGAGGAKITAVKDAGTNGFHVTAEAYAGAKIDQAAVAKQVTGKQFGEAADIASHLPGVDHAQISTWPSFNTHLPRITSHIKVEIKVAGVGG
jgi:hypothetical protein